MSMDIYSDDQDLIRHIQDELDKVNARLEGARSETAAIRAERDHVIKQYAEYLDQAEAFAKQGKSTYDPLGKFTCDPTNTGSRFTSRADHKELKAPEWLIDMFIPENADVALYAPFAALKTFVAIDLACAIATGVLALGQFDVNGAGPVYFFAGEGYHSMVSKRITAWEIFHDLEPFSAPNIKVANGVPITTDDALIESDILAIERDLGDQRCRFFVIDTMNRALNGQDEDKSHVAARYLQTVKRIRDRIGGTSLTISHMGKDPDRGERGSSGFPAGFDTIIWIEKIKKDEATGTHTIQLWVRKQKDAEDGQRYWLQSQKVETPTGDSLVLVPVDPDEGQAAIKGMSDNADGALSEGHVRGALENLVPHGGRVDRKELVEELVTLTGKVAKTINNALSANNKKGGKFYRYAAPDNQWQLPLNEQLPQSVADILREMDEEQKAASKGNSIFH